MLRLCPRACVNVQGSRMSPSLGTLGVLAFVAEFLLQGKNCSCWCRFPLALMWAPEKSNCNSAFGCVGCLLPEDASILIDRVHANLIHFLHPGCSMYVVLWWMFFGWLLWLPSSRVSSRALRANHCALPSLFSFPLLASRAEKHLWMFFSGRLVTQSTDTSENRTSSMACLCLWLVGGLFDVLVLVDFGRLG